MNYPTIRFHYDRKGKASEDRDGTIDIEVYFNRKRKYISTGVRVRPHEWRDDKVVKRSDSAYLNAILDNAFNSIRDHVLMLKEQNAAFSFEALDTNIANSKLQGSFLEYARMRILKRKDIRETTRKAQGKLPRILEKYGRMNSFSEVTAYRIRHFDSWLHEREIRQTTIGSYHRMLKTYIHMAMADGLIERDPYANFKVNHGKAEDRRYLTEEELARVKAVETEDQSVMRVKDLFLFQCYTGLAYADLAAFDFEKVEKRNGKHILHARRQKTGVEYHIVLLSPVMEILERYGYKLPILTNQKYNMMLKVLSAYASLRFSLTSHCGRHTYATWCLNKGVPIETLKTMMGHTDSRTTSLYAKILDRTVEAAFDGLESAI